MNKIVLEIHILIHPEIPNQDEDALMELLKEHTEEVLRNTRDPETDSRFMVRAYKVR